MASKYPFRYGGLMLQDTVTSLDSFAKVYHSLTAWAPQWQRFLARSYPVNARNGGFILDGGAVLKFVQEHFADSCASFSLPTDNLVQPQSHNSPGKCKSVYSGQLRSTIAANATYVNNSNYCSPPRASLPSSVTFAITGAFTTCEARRQLLSHDGCTSITGATSFHHRHGGASAGYCTVAGVAIGSGRGAAKMSTAIGEGCGGEKNGLSQSHAAKGGAVEGRSADAHATGPTGSGNDAGGAAAGGGGEGSTLGRIQPRLMMVFTCTKCETRSTKSFSKQSYTRGVVLVRCPGCHRLHLIADHLRWFGEEPFMLHEFLTGKGENVIRVTMDDHAEATAPHPAVLEAQPRASAAAASLAMPGLTARTAAAAAAVAASEGGVFELGSELQVREALEAAREVQDHRHESKRQPLETS
ncbi:hypothetical protein VaNZ11_002256 [Volvox africanus]|uniref:DNL-type domain-containing protein n=1 Tax=Volvox africanus TaxID=51714 RepID=A0ABQ5RRK0_9CHLO|nr:hypothetical protein VaNZ11_002256 [Volvox africanus]